MNGAFGGKWDVGDTWQFSGGFVLAFGGRLLVLFLLFFLLRAGEILSINGDEPFIGRALKHRD